MALGRARATLPWLRLYGLAKVRCAAPRVGSLGDALAPSDPHSKALYPKCLHSGEGPCVRVPPSPACRVAHYQARDGGSRFAPPSDPHSGWQPPMGGLPSHSWLACHVALSKATTWRFRRPPRGISSSSYFSTLAHILSITIAPYSFCQEYREEEYFAYNTVLFLRGHFSSFIF